MSGTKSLAEEFGIQPKEQLDLEDPVMLIEDQQDLRLIVTHHMGKLGFRTIKQFANGHEALHHLRENPTVRFGVTIADRDMPILGGYDFFLEVRENPSYQRSAFAIALDSPDRSEIMLASEKGVDGILVKPFSLKDIVPKLRQAFKVFHNPNNPELVYELAKRELQSKNFDKAFHIYRRLMQNSSQSARPLVGLARIAIEKKEYDQAHKYLMEAEARNKFYVHTFSERGRVFVNMNKAEEAIVEFKKAIQLSPLNPIRYEEASELLFKLQKYQEAIDLLTIALEAKLSFPRLHHILSQSYFALKNYKSAIRHVKLAVAQEPENIVYLNQLGICYKESDQFEEANKTYNAVIKIDPSNRSALYNKSIMLASKGQTEEAIKLIKRCIEKHPDFDAARKKLAEFEDRGQKAV